ncbi:Fe-S cluster assembly protein SufD [Mucilaginibacter sp.]|uniref:Fe-S cluster assembly protein SufD n=1 Tax=Mucilaginibacter sp. TaxID=1882438 RepID=UPI00374D5597
MNLTYIKDSFEQLKSEGLENAVARLRLQGFEAFEQTGLPTRRNEEWKYTGISGLFDNPAYLAADTPEAQPESAIVDAVRLPGHLQANELVFVNGRFSPMLSTIRSPKSQLTVLPLEEAAKGSYKELVMEHLGKSSASIRDGVHALNTSFIQEGVFIHVAKGQLLRQPLYLYHISDARQGPVLAQPRSLVIIGENTTMQLVETYHTLGPSDSFTNQVMEVVLDKGARLEYYKIQEDAVTASQVSTTHIRQIGNSFVHAVTVTLNGGIIRNNMQVVMEAPESEAHLYGLYILNGHTHADNHTLVDHTQPNCLSNEYYKGILDGQATGVFNGKIMVRPDAQKTNAYQTNKNVLLGDDATINTKPQLEIFADDVKCSHGCTVGQLDENALFYLTARGIPKADARVLLLQAFALDITEQVKPEPLKKYITRLISERLSKQSL